jgi:ferric iron reductase protein FhuF
MAFQSSQLIDDLAWQRPFRRAEPSLADELREHFATHRAYFNDIIRLSEPLPETTLTFYQWAQPATLTSLLARYADHIYREQPQQPREGKPLKSLWAQWYLGLLVPPLIMALVTHPRALDISPAQIHVEFHESGRAAAFWLDVQEDRAATVLPLRLRMEKLIVEGVLPIVNALEDSGDINGKLIWANTGYLINWLLGEIKDLLGDEAVSDLRHACFFESQLSNGQNNPLYRTVVPREGLLVRRTCCQRYKLPGVQGCGDCTLK